MVLGNDILSPQNPSPSSRQSLATPAYVSPPGCPYALNCQRCGPLLTRYDIMFKLNTLEILFITLIPEGFLYGLYSGVFAMYLKYQLSKKDTDKKQSIVFYSICVLYALSIALFAADITVTLYQLLRKPLVSVLRIYFIDTTLFGCCDFIAQFILIYRCWIVWGCNIRVVIIPSILAFAFLVSWLVSGSGTHISSGLLVTPNWGVSMALSSVALSLTVNALVTGLIVFRIFKVFWEVRAATDDQNLGATGGSKLRHVMFILIESGMALFAIQLARVVLTIVETGTGGIAFAIIVTLHEMLTGITPTIILVRTSMGLSFHDEKSMEEVAIGSFRFASNHSNAVQETGVVNVVGQDNRDGDIGVERSSNDIELVAR